MGWGNVNNWQYSRLVKNVARNARITNPVGAELEAIRVFLKFLWNPVTGVGTRSWLSYQFKDQSRMGEYDGDIDAEPAFVLVEMLEIAGGDLKKNPMSLAEKAQADILITATGERRLGTGPLFGGTGGSEYI